MGYQGEMGVGAFSAPLEDGLAAKSRSSEFLVGAARPGVVSVSGRLAGGVRGL